MDKLLNGLDRGLAAGLKAGPAAAAKGLCAGTGTGGPPPWGWPLDGRAACAATNALCCCVPLGGGGGAHARAGAGPLSSQLQGRGAPPAVDAPDDALVGPVLGRST